MGMDRARRAQREARVGLGARGAQDLHEVQHGGEVARLELQRAPQVVQAFIVAPKEVVQHGALVPRLGEVRNASQQHGEAGFRDVEAPCRDIPRGEVQGLGGAMVRMVHPHVPDPILGFRGLYARTAGQAAEQLIEKGGCPDGPPGAIAANQPENFNQ